LFSETTTNSFPNFTLWIIAKPSFAV